MTQSTDESIVSVATSKIADFASGLIFRARPIVILHHISTDVTVTIKLKRGVLGHTLYLVEGDKEVVLKKSLSALLLLATAMNTARKYIARGFIEI